MTVPYPGSMPQPRHAVDHQEQTEPPRPRERAGLAGLAALVGDGDVLVLSGAGISTDSGIPDYRGPSGRRRHAAPMTYQRFTGSPEERRRYWARSHLGWATIAQAKPNVAHRAVAALQHAGLVTGVVTQNVDGLHSAAGARDVVDLHGRLDAVVCLGCGDRRSRIEVGLRLEAVNPGFRAALEDVGGTVRPDGDMTLPEDVIRRFRTVDCRRCGGMLKPDVVYFGEHVPRARFQAALARLESARALLVLGSSLAVGSGYRFVTRAVRRGVPVAIVNRGETRGDQHAAVKVDDGLGVTLPALLEVLALEQEAPHAAAG
jgi:NAD-dependent SIR2 family protein deacetylase